MQPPAPLVSACIPDIPRGKGNWRKAIEDWKGSLRDWPKENFTGRMRPVSASKQSTRQTIAEEYKRYGDNDEAFLAVYGEAAERGITALLKAIRKRNGRQRNSKNGTPSECTSHQL
ncbi:hypothetical protein APHAL10511_008621 [Amanita phalloides]|nr:hypothetical protein APHAL10511_008621 [Amanita phalloides]